MKARDGLKVGDRIIVTEGLAKGPCVVTGLGVGFLYVKPDKPIPGDMKGTNYCVAAGHVEAVKP